MDAYTPTEGKGVILGVPLPFAFLSFVLFLTPKARGLWALPLSIPAWLVAWFSTLFVMVHVVAVPFVAMWVGGLVGGLGVTLSAGIVYHRLLSSRYLIRAAMIGGVSALPFGFWLILLSGGESVPLQSLRLRCAFAIWQAAVGTYLYVVCTRLKKGAPPEDSSTTTEQP